MKPLTDAQKTLISELAVGGIVCVAEYRGETPEIVSYVDKELGKVRHIIKHNLALEFLSSGEQMPAELYTDRAPAVDKSVDAPKPPLPDKTNLEKGEIVICEIGSYTSKAGVVTCKIKTLIRLNDPANLPLPIREGKEATGVLKEYLLKDRSKKTPSAA